MLLIGVVSLSRHGSYASPPVQSPTPQLIQTIGMVAVSSPMTLYSQPNAQSAIIEKLSWSFDVESVQESITESGAQNKLMSSQGLFTVFVPKYQLAMLPVLDEVNGWYQVQLPHMTGAMGWLPPSKSTTSLVTQPSSFVTWQELMFMYGKRFGFHWLSGVSPSQKSVHLRPEDDAPLAKITFIQGIRVLHVRGNWMLVELRDMGDERPIGWLRWRDDDGNLLIWPNFEMTKALYQSPSNPMNVEEIMDTHFDDRIKFPWQK